MVFKPFFHVQRFSSGYLRQYDENTCQKSALEQQNCECFALHGSRYRVFVSEGFRSQKNAGNVSLFPCLSPTLLSILSGLLPCNMFTCLHIEMLPCSQFRREKEKPNRVHHANPHTMESETNSSRLKRFRGMLVLQLGRLARRFLLQVSGQNFWSPRSTAPLCSLCDTCDACEKINLCTSHMFFKTLGKSRHNT